MPRAEAEAYRPELMDERKVFVEKSDSNYFGQEFNMWCIVRFLRLLSEELAEISKFSKH